MTKAFLAILLLFSVVLIVTTRLGWVSLHGTGVDEAIGNYEYYAHWIWRWVPLSALILLILANILVFRINAFWPLWSVATYWCFGLLVYLWLGDQYNFFRINRFNEIYDAPIPIGPVMFAFFAVPALLVVAIDHFVAAVILRSWQMR